MQGTLPEPLFERLWRARVRDMLRRRERHVCKLQTISDIMARLIMPALAPTHHASDAHVSALAFCTDSRDSCGGLSMHI